MTLAEKPVRLTLDEELAKLNKKGTKPDVRVLPNGHTQFIFKKRPSDKK